MLPRVCFRLYTISIIGTGHRTRCMIKIPLRYYGSTDSSTPNNGKPVEWNMLAEYAFRSSLLRFSYPEMRGT